MVLLTVIKYFSTLLPFIAYFFIKEKVSYKRYFFWYTFFCLANTFLTIRFYKLGLSELYYINNLIYTPVEFIFFSLIFIKIYTLPRNVKIIKYGAVLFFLLWIFITLISKPAGFDSIAVGIEELFIFAYSLIYFYEKIKNPDTVFIYTSSAFWAVTSLFIYASGTFFVYLFAASLWNNEAFSNQYDSIHLSISIIKNLLITFVLVRKEHTNTIFSLHKSLN